jgi:hypothetical protein
MSKFNVWRYHSKIYKLFYVLLSFDHGIRIWKMINFMLLTLWVITVLPLSKAWLLVNLFLGTASCVYCVA